MMKRNMTYPSGDYSQRISPPLIDKYIADYDRMNHLSTYTYTPTDKINTITYLDSSTVSYHYNNLDQLIGMEDAVGTTDHANHPYTYDDAGRLTHTRDSNGNTVGYAYDEMGNLTTLTYPDGKTVTYTYDKLNRLKTVTIDWLSSNKVAIYTDYDAADRLPGFTNFNSTTTDYGYDNANRLTSINNQAGANVISSYAFTLDGNGNRTTINQTEPYAAAMDNNAVTYAYNTYKNRLTSAGSTNYTYDDEGQIATASSNTYTFDYEHRLKTISSPATTFYYDGNGNRLKAVRSGVTTKYIYDASGMLLAEADASNNITKYYIYGLGLLAAVTPDNNIYCYHFNGVGSTIAMTDNTQTVVNKYSYDVFGNIANQSETITQPFKYVGQYGVMTEPNGFYYMKARYYDPAVGRFISEDPSGFGGGDVNLMAYVGNNPVLRTDPLGDAYLVIRPLDQWPLQNTTAGPLYHSAFQYDSGRISGYNPEPGTGGIISSGFGVVGPDANSVSKTVISQYQKVGIYLDDNILDKAEVNLAPKWNQRINPNITSYWLFFHNCHGYTNAVLKEYDLLMVSNQLSSRLGGVFGGSKK